MPNIRTYISNAPPLRADDRGAQAESQLAYHAERQAEIIPRQIDEATRALREGLDVFTKRDEAQQISSGYKQLTALAAEAHDDLSKTLNSADPSKGNPIPKWMETFLQPRLSKIEEGLSSPVAQREFQRASAGLQETLTDHGIGQWDSLVTQHTLNNVQQSTVSLGNAGVTDPASLPGILKLSDAGIDSFVKSSGGRVSAEDGVKLAQNSRQQIVEATAESLVTQTVKNPAFNTGMAAQLEKQLNDPIFTDNMDPKKRAQLLSVIAGAHGTQEVAESQIFKSRLPDMLEQAKLTGDTRQIDAGIQMLQEKTPEETAVAKQEAADKRNAALAFYTVSHDAGSVPRDKEADYLAQRQTDLRFAMPENVGAANAAHKAAQQFFAERDKAFVSGNQAQFLIDHNETINAYKQTFDQNPTAANFDRYASYSSALQRHLYPGVAPRVLTPEMTSGIATAMHAINESGTGAAVAAKTLSDAAKLTGHFWPGISRELLEKKVINGDQFTAALLFSDPRAASLAPALLSASAMTATQRAELHGIPEQKVESFAAKAFDGFNKTLANIPEAAEVMGAHATALTHLMQVQGLSTQTDATALAKKMLLDQYTIVDDTLRLPSAGVDASAIESGAERTRKELGPLLIDVPKSLSGLGSGDQRANYIRQIQQTGRWYTNGDGSGATLYPAAGAAMPVTVEGKPLSLSWDDLAKRGQ